MQRQNKFFHFFDQQNIENMLSHMGKTEGVGVAGGGQFMSASWVGGMGNHTGTISKQGTRKTFLIIPVRFAIVHFLPRSAPAAPKSVCVLLESY